MTADSMSIKLSIRYDIAPVRITNAGFMLSMDIASFGCSDINQRAGFGAIPMDVHDVSAGIRGFGWDARSLRAPLT